MKKINPMRKLKDYRNQIVKDFDTELEEQGVILFKPKELGGTLNIDSSNLGLPKDITNCTSKDLGQLLNSFTQHRMYVRTLIGWQQTIVEQKKREYEEVSTPIYLSLSKKDFPSESSKEKYVTNHEEVLPFYYNYCDANRKLSMLNLNILSIDDSIFLISREITRRNSDFNIETREENISKR